MNFYSITETGRVRSENQDFLFATDQKIGPLQNLFLVADGMGGHNAGEYASEHAVTTVISEIRNAKEGEPVPLLKTAIASANQNIYLQAKADVGKTGMGTTLVAATFADGHLYVANVGDSRLYVITRNGIRQITRDHSYVGELVRQGTISEAAARNHVKKHYITRAVGTESTVKIDFFDVLADEEGYVLLCTDGLTNMVTDAEIERIIHMDLSIEEKVKRLYHEADENGGRDNITLILIES